MTTSVRRRCAQRRRTDVVMLVLNVTDNFLDQILDRHQTVRTAIFINHQRQMRARRLHFE